MKKILAMILCAVMVLGLCAGCGSTAATTEAAATEPQAESAETESTAAAAAAAEEGFTPRLDTDAEVTIHVVGGFDNFPSLVAVTENFAEYYPNVTIEYEKLDSYVDTLSMRLYNNDSADIYMCSYTQSTATEGIMEYNADLADEALGFDLTALDAGVLSSNMVGDTLPRLPIYSAASGLLVNKTLLAECGLEIPTTYGEFIECCKTLEEAGYHGLLCYYNLKDADGNLTELDKLDKTLVKAFSKSPALVKAALENADGSLSDAVNNGEEGSAEIYRESFELLADLAESGVVCTDIGAELGNSYGDAILRFFEGDVGFLAATTTTMSGTAKRESESEAFTACPFEYSFIACPNSEEGAYTYLDMAEGLALNKNSENFDYAAEFLRFYCTIDQLNISADKKGVLSPSSDASSSEIYPDIDLSNDEFVGNTGEFRLDNAASKAYEFAAVEIFFHGVSVDQAMEDYYTFFEQNS